MGAEQFQVSFAGVTKSMASVYLIRVAPRPNLDLGHRSRLPEPTKSRRRSARTSRDWVARRYADMLRTLEQVEVLGPAPDPIPRMNAEWRYRIAIKAGDSSPVRAFVRETLQPAARAERGTRLIVNVDP